ncbi:hypothetical protein AWB78_00863 [Caballeronia calidae]|uniref:Uncharacterized protein n=1 Tax=Caballeronia calidae TaxID=1777139 RepID=A0A157ZTL1_9BURK|nr:hypothetical protein [Caballeronia calidae]SAK48257.1 hypothetical protein AWB78_00863 [Caballeronia calidae]
MQDADALVSEFLKNVDQIAGKLIKFVGLRHTDTVNHLNAPLLRWLDFRLRFIDPRPRQIFLSDEFPKTLSPSAKRAFDVIKVKVAIGENINAHQGTGLVDFDTSGKKRAARTDLLWADWGIHHLHLDLDPHPKREYFSRRADYLLFAVFGHDYAAFVDVLPHRGDDLLFARQRLIEIIGTNWPELIERFQLKRVLASNQEISDQHRHELRRSGLDAPLIVAGKAYFAPGGGVTSASTPGLVTESMFRLKQNVRSLAHCVLDPRGQFLGALPERDQIRSHFSLELSPRGIVVFERTTNRGWAFPDAKGDSTDSYFAELSDCLTPAWVKDALLKAHEASAKNASATAPDSVKDNQSSPSV